MAISGGVEENTYLETPAFTHFRKRCSGSWCWHSRTYVGIDNTGLPRYAEESHNTRVLYAVTEFNRRQYGVTIRNGGFAVACAGRAEAGRYHEGAEKELVVSLLISVCVGVLVSLRVFILSHGSEDIPASIGLERIAFMISLALSIQVVWSTLLGAVIPVFASRMKIDPAVVSSPAIATFVDVGGITIYFVIAKLLLGI